MKKTNIASYKKILKNPPIAFKRWFDAEKKYLVSNIKKNSKVLAIGCGNGKEIKYILENTKNVIGIDHDKDAVRETKRNFKQYPKIKIMLAEATKLLFKNNSFDYVLCIESFNNFGVNKIPVLKEMKRVLKENGKIILSAYSEDAMSERMKIYKKIGAPILKIKGTTVYLDYNLNDNISEQFSRKQLTGFFNKVKLKIKNIKKVGIGYVCILSK